jgi:hypothetical protein
MFLGKLKSNPQSLNIFTKILFRSSAYSIAAFFIALILEKILMIAGAVIEGYSVFVNYEDIGILVDPSAWDQESVLIIYLLPFLIQVVILVLLFVNLQRWHAKPGYFMIFILWIMFFMAYRLVGMLPLHLYFKTGIYHAFEWLYLGSVFDIIMAICGIAVFFVAGSRILKGILFFSATFNDHVRQIGLPNTVRSSLLGPALLNFAIPWLFFLPGMPKDEIYGLIVMVAVSFFVIIMLLYGKPELFPKGIAVKENYSFTRLFFIIILLVLILRIILGLDFTIN